MPSSPSWALGSCIFIRQHVIISVFPSLMMSWSNTNPISFPTDENASLIAQRSHSARRAKGQAALCVLPGSHSPWEDYTTTRLSVPALPGGTLPGEVSAAISLLLASAERCMKVVKYQDGCF